MKLLGWNKKLSEKQCKFLRRRFSSAGTKEILDIGGISGEFFLGNGFSLTVVSESVFPGNSLERNHFGAVLCSSLCWHTKEGGEFFVREMGKPLKRDGFLYLRVPKREIVFASATENSAFVNTVEDWTILFSDKNGGGVVRGFSKKDFTFLEKEFRIIEIFCEDGVGISVLARKR